MENLFEIKNLNVDFKTPRGRVHALRDVSFKAPRGKIIGVVGESGSGKSTVIWAMTQLLAGNGVVEGGEILFNGKNVLELSERELLAFRGEEASIVFQDPMTSQIPVMSYARQMVDIAYRRALGRPATDSERHRVVSYVRDFVTSKPASDAWASVFQAIFASAEFRYVR